MAGKRSAALRLVFEYEGSVVRFLSRQRVEMVVPPGDPAQAQKGEGGFWYELRDANDRTLYRRVAANPIRMVAEVRSDNPEEPFTWEPVADPKGTFVLLVPDEPQAHSVALFSPPLEAERLLTMAEPAAEIARFALAGVGGDEEEQR